jgi:hypothetical protein
MFCFGYWIHRLDHIFWFPFEDWLCAHVNQANHLPQYNLQHRNKTNLNCMDNRKYG